MRYIPLPETANKGYLIGDQVSHAVMVAEQTRYRATMGLNPEQIHLVPGVNTPLFLAHAADHFRDKWPGLNPKMAWHPLLWLPDEILYTRDIDDGNGIRQMSEMEWAASIALHCEMLRGCEYDEYTLVPIWDINTPLVQRQRDKDNFGVHIPHYEQYDYDVEADVFFRRKNPGEKMPIALYNNLDGSWLDVLSLIGIDVFSPGGEARVSAWLKGASDPQLDGFSIAPLLHLDGRADTWALNMLSRPMLKKVGEDIIDQTPRYVDMIERSGAFPIVNDAAKAFISSKEKAEQNLAAGKKAITTWMQVVDFYCSPGPEFSALVKETIAGVNNAVDRQSLLVAMATFDDAFRILYDGIFQDGQDFIAWFNTFYDETYFHMTYIDGER